MYNFTLLKSLLVVALKIHKDHICNRSTFLLFLKLFFFPSQQKQLNLALFLNKQHLKREREKIILLPFIPWKHLGFLTGACARTTGEDTPVRAWTWQVKSPWEKRRRRCCNHFPAWEQIDQTYPIINYSNNNNNPRTFKCETPYLEGKNQNPNWVLFWKSARAKKKGKKNHIK